MELPPGVQIKLAARIKSDGAQPFLCPATEFTTAVGDKYGRVPDFAESRDGELDLMLSAPPRPRRVEMDGRHRIAHNFANLRNT